MITLCGFLSYDVDRLNERQLVIAQIKVNIVICNSITL